MDKIAQLAGVLQGLLTETAERVGRECGLIQRQREFTASSLLSTFVWGCLQWASPKWEQLAGLARERGACVSPQAVEQRITPALRDSLYQLWQAAVECVVSSEPRTTPVLKKFTDVFIGDSTTISLSAELAETFPGCGGREGRAEVAVDGAYGLGELEPIRCRSGQNERLDQPAERGHAARRFVVDL